MRHRPHDHTHPRDSPTGGESSADRNRATSFSNSVTAKAVFAASDSGFLRRSAIGYA